MQNKKPALTLHLKVLLMKDNNYLEHLQGIKGILEERTKFKVLSGLSGVFAGIWALAGAYVADGIIYNTPEVIYTDVKEYDVYSPDLRSLLWVSFITLVGAVSTIIFFSYRNARRSNTRFWSPAAAKLVLHFSIPMVMGGIFVLALLYRSNFGLIAPSCLIFYGLAVVNASHYTYSDVRALGIALLITGSIALFFPGWGLYLWALGFGVLHIIYGAIMYFKYEK